MQQADEEHSHESEGGGDVTQRGMSSVSTLPMVKRHKIAPTRYIMMVVLIVFVRDSDES